MHHAQACVGSRRGQRDPLQLAEHSVDAAGIVPEVADIPVSRFLSFSFVSRVSKHLIECIAIAS